MRLPGHVAWGVDLAWCLLGMKAQRSARAVGFGFYPRSGFIHVDLGPARHWGERFPVRETAFAAETPPAREVLADSRTMKGGGGR